ncbi:MAG: alginate export family protein, partial [Candidatus Subteraquimicrobiales bacterium]|nr:alginate export family protein [Candidatus Subteraquimicrobiales bacterium]
TTQITLGGELRFRGWYLDDYSEGRRTGAGTPLDSPSQGWYDGRVRLRLQADVSKNTMGVVHLETADGGSRTSDGYTWGSLNQKAGATGTTLTVLEAWILHKGSGLLGIPAGLKVGHMPLALGEKQFLDHTKFGDDAIVLFADPTKELHIGLLTAKLVENSAATAGTMTDTNAYVALATYKVNKDNTVGVNYTTITSGVTLTTTGQKFNFQNLGLHANGKIADVKYAVEYDTQFGNQTDAKKFKGYGIFANLGYDIKPATLRLGYAQGSGDAGNTDTTKNKDFQVTAGNDVHYTFIYEFTTRDASSSRGLGQAAARSNGIANTTYYRLGLDAELVKDLKASVDYFILRATKVATGSKKIGTEVDVKLAYKIDRNLTYSVTAGILDGGAWWENTAATAPGISAVNNKKITQMMHALTLSF